MMLAEEGVGGGGRVLGWAELLLYLLLLLMIAFIFTACTAGVFLVVVDRFYIYGLYCWWISFRCWSLLYLRPILLVYFFLFLIAFIFTAYTADVELHGWASNSLESAGAPFGSCDACGLKFCLRLLYARNSHSRANTSYAICCVICS